MENVVVHIISHSHWDREWYLPLKVTACNWWNSLTICLIFWKWSGVQSFHLDGQTIVLDDYLEIRPENRDKVQRYIDEGKLQDWSLLHLAQDDYLISSEANVRNTLIGQAECAKWGKSTQIGYFPDTLGNMGQAPQILQKSGIHVAAFWAWCQTNRIWQPGPRRWAVYLSIFWNVLAGADGSRVLGILFANWYSNGNEIPVDKDEALAFWKQNWQTFVIMPQPTNGWWWTAVTTNRFNETWVKPFVWQTNSSLTWPLFIAHLTNMSKRWKVPFLNTYQLLQVSWLARKRMVGTLANTSSSRVYLKQAFQENSNLLRASGGTFDHHYWWSIIIKIS